MQTLQSNTLLQGGRYKVIKKLGYGNFLITCLALQSGQECQVAAREFYTEIPTSCTTCLAVFA